MGKKIFTILRWNFLFILTYEKPTIGEHIQFEEGSCLKKIKYSKTCFKWPLKNKLNKDLKDKW